MCIFPAFRDFYGLWLNMAYGKRPKAVSQHWSRGGELFVIGVGDVFDQENQSTIDKLSEIASEDPDSENGKFLWINDWSWLADM